MCHTVTWALANIDPLGVGTLAWKVKAKDLPASIMCKGFVLDTVAIMGYKQAQANPLSAQRSGSIGALVLEGGVVAAHFSEVATKVPPVAIDSTLNISFTAVSFDWYSSGPQQMQPMLLLTFKQPCKCGAHK